MKTHMHFFTHKLRTIGALLLLISLTGPQNAAPSDLKGPDGKPRKLKDTRARITIVNFWATWCVPCRKEIPILNEIQQRYKDRGVRVIGITVDDKSTAGQIDDFMKKTPFGYEVWRKGSAEDMDKLGFVFAIPATAILDQKGKVVERFTGEISIARLTNRIDRLLAR